MEPISPDERDAHCDAVFTAIGAKLETLPGLPPPGPPHYSAVGDVIRMPEFGAFSSAAAYAATLCHATIHWSGARDRLDRGRKGPHSDADYARAELVAEFGALFMGMEMGLGTATHELHDDYLADWTKLLTDKPTELFTAASRAQRAVDYLDDLVRQNGLEHGLTLPSATAQVMDLSSVAEPPLPSSDAPDVAGLSA